MLVLLIFSGGEPLVALFGVKYLAGNPLLRGNEAYKGKLVSPTLYGDGAAQNVSQRDHAREAPGWPTHVLFGRRRAYLRLSGDISIAGQTLVMDGTFSGLPANLNAVEGPFHQRTITSWTQPEPPPPRERRPRPSQPAAGQGATSFSPPGSWLARSGSAA